MTNIDYKAAYERQKKARELSDKLLEDKTRELHEANDTLKVAYERLRNQKSQLLHQEKLASIGQLSAGVAHEINNPSAYVKSNLNSLVRYMGSILEFTQEIGTKLRGGEFEEYFEELKVKHDIDFLFDDFNDLISDSVFGMDKIATIVSSLNSFSRSDEREKHPFNPNEAIQTTVKLVWNEIKYSAELDENYSEIDEVNGHIGGFSQVILNLLVNASQSIEENGRISIDTDQNDKEIIIKVSDTGKGIEPDNLHRIFDPFFTTKPTGKGTGLGLSISHGIIKKHGGTLNVSSVVGKGTTFTIILPRQNAK